MLSVVITAWNEEKNLPRAISSAKALADEIVVVDTESTDGTVAVARKLGAKVFHHKNTGIVEPVRNFSISKARGDWILLLDADEEIPGTLLPAIREAVSNAKFDYFRIPRQNIIFGKWIKSAHWWPDYVYRLFKKGSITWDETIHSIPLTRGTGRDLPADAGHSLIHHHYSTVSQYVDRLNRYTDLQVQAVLARGHNFSWTDLVDKPGTEFIRQYFANRGYADGLHGLALSGLQAFSELVLYLKLWQSGGFVAQDIEPLRVNDRLAKNASEWRWWKFQAEIDRSPVYLRPLLKITRKFFS